MTLAPGDLYWKKTPMEVDWFIEVMNQFPMLTFFQPNPNLAPWHVQCRELPINIWPHTGKCYLEGHPTRWLADGFAELVLKACETEPEPELKPVPIKDPGDISF